MALFLVLNAIKCMKDPFSQEHFRCSIPHICQPILPKFIGHPTFRLEFDKVSSRQLLLRHCYAIQNKNVGTLLPSANVNSIMVNHVF